MNPSFDELMHYGTKRHSGRYPWGSGENPYQHEDDFLRDVHRMREENFTYTDADGKTYTGDLAIAKSMGLTSTQFRTQLSLANNEHRKKEVERAKQLRAEGKSLNEIAAEMGYKNDSSIRSLLNEDSEARMNQAQATADFLKQQVAEKGMIDVGTGVERQLNISREKLNEALYILEMEGYPIYGGGVPQITNPNQQTNLKVLCPPGTEHKEIYDFKNIRSVQEDWVSHDDGETFDPKFVYPESMDSKRLKIRYADDGGINKDGVIEIRRGVADLDLGGSHYAQVRILVDGTHYLKGMAVYGDDDDFPDGVDVIFNTNKNSDTPTMGPKNNTILKPIKEDPRNPFGSLIKDGIDDPDVNSHGGGQSYYYDSDGKKKLSLINKRAEEGDWGDWSDKLPSQFLSKQSMQLINRQLDVAKADKKAEFDDIMAINNPTVRKMRLKSFADDCDASAVHLKAAALPRQKYQVILPLESIKEDEVYAPNYNNGEKVALIRYPHGGTFEIPILTVNNKLPEGKKYIGTDPKDAVGINSKVAGRLSGADFDGDTVMVIPCNNPRSTVSIVSTPPLKGLEGFDPKMTYGGKADGTYKKMKNTQTEMGKISNLITDMTLKKATDGELARAVRHSMVVIDAEKHGLDYKQSEKDNGIKDLKKKYQGRIENGKYRDGASTLISRAKGEVQVLKTKGSPKIDPETGKQTYKQVVETYTDKNGKTKVRTKTSTQMAETDDAFTLSSGTPQETAYAKYANYMKSMANEARKAMVNTKDNPYSPAAKEIYKKEVASLDAKLNVSLMNAPKERRAQAMANAIVAEKKKMYPDMKSSELKKVKNQALVDSRIKVGAQRNKIEVTPKEWEAIQAGAISANKLTQIIQYMDQDQLAEYTSPYNKKELSPAKQAKIRAMAMSGYTPSEIAAAVGVSTSTVNKYTH